MTSRDIDECSPGTGRKLKEDNTVVNIADLMEAIHAAVDSDDVAEKLLRNVLSKLNVDGNGRLRVSAEAVANMTTLTTVTNVANLGTSNIGLLPATSLAQAEGHMRYQQGFRRNLVIT